MEAYLTCLAVKKQINESLRTPVFLKNRKMLYESLECILAFFQTEGEIPDELYDAWDQIKVQWNNATPSGLSSIKEETDTFFAFSLEELAKYLLAEIKLKQEIEKEEAEEYFTFFEQIPRNTVRIFTLIFHVCNKCSLKHPQKSFDWTMKLFEENPALLSGKGNAHPDYIYRESEQRTFHKCPICGGTGKPFFRAMAYDMSDFSYPALPAKLWMSCEDCGNLYTWKFQEAYLKQAEYYRLLQPEKEKFWLTSEPVNSTSLALWAKVLERLQTYSSSNTLLEVGVGRGELIAVALELGYEVDAVELNQDVAQKVANLLDIPVWNCDFLQYHAEKKYSRIIMGDVIEHVQSPEEALKNAYRLLEDDGVLWVSTPNYASSYSKFMKLNDPMWKEPNHISYFCYEGLERLAAKCGFKAVDYQVSRRYNGSMEVVFVKAGRKIR